MAAQLLSTAKNLTNQLIRDVRNISLELRPTILDDLGLLPAFLWHFDRYTSLTGIKVNFQHRQVDHRFSKEIETATYRIMQEALTNVARYAGVSEVSVFLLAAQDTLILQIEDQGKGFLIDRSQNSPPTGGISGMQERAQLCGGQLIVESNPGKGTFLSLELPLKALHMERRKNER
jgi:signal transduction histidine kinase